jgi:hypothetical protein
MAEMCAPFCHPRLSATAAVNATSSSGNSGDTTVINVWAIPHGAQIGEGGMIVWPNGDTEPAQPLEPYQPTPDWTQAALTDQRAQPEPAPFGVAEAEPPENVANLGAYRRSREEPPDESGAA